MASPLSGWRSPREVACSAWRDIGAAPWRQRPYIGSPSRGSQGPRRMARDVAGHHLADGGPEAPSQMRRAFPAGPLAMAGPGAGGAMSGALKSVELLDVDAGHAADGHAGAGPPISIWPRASPFFQRFGKALLAPARLGPKPAPRMDRKGPSTRDDALSLRAMAPVSPSR